MLPRTPRAAIRTTTQHTSPHITTPTHTVSIQLQYSNHARHTQPTHPHQAHQQSTHASRPLYSRPTCPLALHPRAHPITTHLLPPPPPLDGKFKQQKLRAWKPILTPQSVLPNVLLIGVVFIAVGAALFSASNSVRPRCPCCPTAPTPLSAAPLHVLLSTALSSLSSRRSKSRSLTTRSARRSTTPVSAAAAAAAAAAASASLPVCPALSRPAPHDALARPRLPQCLATLASPAAHCWTTDPRVRFAVV